MMDADTNDNQPNDSQSGMEGNTDNIEELRLEDASADIDFDKAFGSEEEQSDVADDVDISAEDAFAQEAGARVALQQQVSDLQAPLDDRTGQFTRLTADFDNFRKRTDKQREDLEVQVKCNTISALLEVVDNFQRARDQIKPQNDGEMAIHKSYQGVYKQLLDALKKLGVLLMSSSVGMF